MVQTIRSLRRFTFRDELTQHLADVRLNVHVLEMLVSVSVKQAEGRVQADGNPDAIPNPGQLSNLALLARMSIK